MSIENNNNVNEIDNTDNIVKPLQDDNPKEETPLYAEDLIAQLKKANPEDFDYTLGTDIKDGLRSFVQSTSSGLVGKKSSRYRHSS